jgi:hypothetical protein
LLAFEGAGPRLAIEIFDSAKLSFRLRQVFSSDTIGAQLETAYEERSAPNWRSYCLPSATASAGGGVEGRSELKQ